MKFLDKYPSKTLPHSTEIIVTESYMKIWGFKTTSPKEPLCERLRKEWEDIKDQVDYSQLQMFDVSSLPESLRPLAFDIKAVSYNPSKPGSEISVYSFSVTESQLSSSARQFLAVFNAVKRMESKSLSSQLSTLYWVTDSQVLTIWLRKGSKVLS